MSNQEFHKILSELGFTDPALIEEAYTAAKGNVDTGIDYLTADPAKRRKLMQLNSPTPSTQTKVTMEVSNKENGLGGGILSPEEETMALIEQLKRQDSMERKDRLKQEAESELLIRQLQKQEEEERRRRKSFNEEQLKKTEEVLSKALQSPFKNVEPNLKVFECLICYTEIAIGDGVMLRSCHHLVCADCIKQNVEFAIKNGEYPVKCPEEKCRAPLAQADIRGIVGEKQFLALEERMLGAFEAQNKNTFHCLTKDCKGWCVFEEDALDFRCMLCKKFNCIPCKAQHPKKNCQQYQEDLKIAAKNDKDAQATQKGIEEMIKKKQMMRCPGCEILVSKLSGCDWMKCRMCKTEICWATMGPRWGPKGKGDTSGGCGCVYPKKKCHPKCGNCH
jgi:RanBP-type and C3HC4-type zinc finger-containing protein 1